MDIKNKAQFIEYFSKGIKGLNQLNSIIEELEAIKFSVKSENDRILKDKLKLK